MTDYPIKKAMSRNNIISNLDEDELSRVKGKKLLTMEEAIEIIVVRSGLIIIPNHKISLPFSVEKDNKKIFLRSHIPVFNTEVLEYTKKRTLN